MKKRLLFVDDEALVLQGIQRMLRGMREEWEMGFAEGGAQALERIAATGCDIVVTDMMMPGMDGAQLLAAVRERSPRTIRLVLSGHAEQQLAMKCVGLAHQYLSKPCDAQTLKRTVARMTGANFAIRNEQVLALVAGLQHLPSLPATYTRIVQLLGDPDATMDDIGALIGSDMAMTAKILQIVNSSFFGLARQVSKPSEAAGFLGLETLKSLVLSTKVFSQFEASLPRGYSAAKAAEHSQQVGAAARAIARAEQAPRAVADAALVAGLLHDVGKLVLASSLPELFQRATAQAVAHPLEAEREVFGGTTHAEVGGYLLGLWGLPAEVVEAITLHHLPGDSEGTEFSALTAVHAADCLIAERAAGGAGAAGPDPEYLARLGLAGRLPAWREAVAELLDSPISSQP